MWDLIVSVPDHCLSFYFVLKYKQKLGRRATENSAVNSVRNCFVYNGSAIAQTMLLKPRGTSPQLFSCYLGRVKRIWYLSPMRAEKVQASLRIRAVSPEPPLLAHAGSESRGTFRQKARSLAPLNGWAYAVKICHDGMLEDTNSLDSAHLQRKVFFIK